MSIGRTQRILVISTGGTIGSSLGEDARTLNRESAEKTRMVLFSAFKASGSPYAGEEDVFCVADYPWEHTTLSESMTTETLSHLVRYIAGIDISDYLGLIVLHGTDTLAFTASLLSFVFSDSSIPIFLVSGNRPPLDPLSNATDNFRHAVDLLLDGIAPNVYVTYRNHDGISRLYLASCLLQSENFSEDFRAAEGEDAKRVFSLAGEGRLTALKQADTLSKRRVPPPFRDHRTSLLLSSTAVRYIRPYTGLDYSLYTAALSSPLSHISAVLHGSYHSGTVSRPGLVMEHEAQKRLFDAERLTAEGKPCEAAEAAKDAEQLLLLARKDAMSSQSIEYLLTACKAADIPLYIAPSHLGCDQYETMNRVSASGAILLPMSAEAAYMKLLLASSFELSKDETHVYMTECQNGEIV